MQKKKSFGFLWWDELATRQHARVWWTRIDFERRTKERSTKQSFELSLFRRFVCLFLCWSNKYLLFYSFVFVSVFNGIRFLQSCILAPKFFSLSFNYFHFLCLTVVFACYTNAISAFFMKKDKKVERERERLLILSKRSSKQNTSYINFVNSKTEPGQLKFQELSLQKWNKYLN